MSSRTSVFVCFYAVFDVSYKAIMDRLTRLTGSRVIRIDYVFGSTGRYCFVHFDQEIHETLWNMLSAGQETIQTAEGPIRIGLNKSSGLDPNTKDTILQYMTTSAGSYCRNFNTGNVYKETQSEWVLSHENPFVAEIQVVEMEDDFTLVAPPAPMKKDKSKRRTTTEEEMDIRRALFI